MNISIRSATPQDYAALCAVMEECDQLHRDRYPDLFRRDPDGRVRSIDYILSLLEDPNSHIFVAEQAGEILGSLVVILRETPPFPILVPRRFALIDNLVVREDQRGKGVGRALMLKAEEWARLNGVDSMELSVYLFNQGAIHLYETLGYAGISQRMAKKLD